MSPAPAGPRSSGPRSLVPPSSVPFRAGTEGYDTFRIPAVVATAEGTLLAFAEGRHSPAADWGHIDVVLRRSVDGGGTWGPLVRIDRGAVGLLFETGDFSACSTLTFRRIPVHDLVP